MTIALHHFFILTEPGAPQADRIADLGLIEGSRNTHPGQGTANRRFFFLNTVLELLYVHDMEEAVSGPGRRLGIAERSTNPAASPFGLIVKASSGASGVPFNSWRYCPEYFASDQCFLVGENADRLEEPLCICMPLNLSIAGADPQRSNPEMNLTSLRISVPVANPSPTLQTFAECPGVSLGLSEPHRLELVFNDGRDGVYNDMAPSLPVILRW